MLQKLSGCKVPVNPRPSRKIECLSNFREIVSQLRLNKRVSGQYIFDPSALMGLSLAQIRNFLLHLKNVY